MNEAVLQFIEVFQSQSNKILFTKCACYWFAKTLHDRFGGCIVYNPGEVHFATDINGVVYDITGVIDREGYVSWDLYEGVDREEIYNSCVLLT